MRKILLTFIILAASLQGARAEVDPNFYIYICFGQSNMEGNATPEYQDKIGIDPRFKMMACVDFQNPVRKKGKWYTATPPLVRQGTGLGMADYFGRTMVENLPENCSVGVIDVAIGGTSIDGFFTEKVKDYLKGKEAWFLNYYAAYDNDPYGRIIEMAKKAQEAGVIKGILLHQGESDNGQEDWPQRVKEVYKRMLTDLGLKAADVPIFVGETEYENMGGGCSWHNHVVAMIPDVIPTGHVVSAEGIPGNGTDPWHFSAAGYRTFGKRYAEKVLDVMNHPENYTKHWGVGERFTTIASLSGKQFAIVNEAEGKAFYGISGQQLGYDVYQTALTNTNEGCLFQINKLSRGWSLRLIDPSGIDYRVDGNVGYLNSQAATGTDCFLQGLKDQRGYDIANGAVWTPEYVEGKGWTLKNGGTGKYLKDATHPAMFDEPTYFTFCTLVEVTTGIREVADLPANSRFSESVYNLQGVKVGDKSNWNTLPRGLYIVNGKKMLKK